MFVPVSILGSEISRSEGSKCTLLAIRSDPSLHALAQRSVRAGVFLLQRRLFKARKALFFFKHDCFKHTVLCFFFNGFYFSLQCLNRLNRSPLWDLPRRLHLTSWLCIFCFSRPCLFLNPCLGRELPWATSTPAHACGTGFYFSISDTPRVIHFSPETHFPSCLDSSASIRVLREGASLDQLWSLIGEISFHFLYMVEIHSLMFRDLSVSSVQFSSVIQSCPTLCDPMNHSMPGLPVHHQLQESTQTRVHWVGDAIQPSHPLSSPSPPTLHLSQHQGLF